MKIVEIIIVVNIIYPKMQILINCYFLIAHKKDVQVWKQIEVPG